MNERLSRLALKKWHFVIGWCLKNLEIIAQKISDYVQVII